MPPSLPRESLFALALHPLFSGLAEPDLLALLGGAEVIARPDDTVVFVREQPADSFFVVLDGHVELFVEDGGRRSVLEVAGRSAMLGEAALFGGRHYLTTARVVGYAKLLVVPAAPFLAALDRRFDLALRMLGSMSMRLRALIVQITELKLKSTGQRLAGFLLGLTTKYDGAAVVRFPYDKRLAAETLGMTAESLSRALLRLAPLGVISRPDNVVAIADLAALREFCVEEAADEPVSRAR